MVGPSVCLSAPRFSPCRYLLCGRKCVCVCGEPKLPRDLGDQHIKTADAVQPKVSRKEAIAKGGKGSRTLDPVPAIEVCESCSYKLCMVPSCDIFAVQSRSVAFILVTQQ